MLKRIIIVTCALVLISLCISCKEPEDDRDIYTVTFDGTYLVLNNDNFDDLHKGVWEKKGDSFERKTDTLGRISNLPPDPTRNDDYYFTGWYTAGNTLVTTRTVFQDDATVFARWDTDVPEYKPLTNRLREIKENAESGDTYTITVGSHEIMAPQELYYDGKTITIKLIGEPLTTGATPNLKLGSMKSLFTIGKGVTLEIDNIWVEGIARNQDALITINDGGKFIMRESPSASRNWTMVYNNGGEEVNSGGGIQVNTGGEFHMYGGQITGCISFDSSGEIGYMGRGGGGVLVRGGDFHMYGGDIFSNVSIDGGGVMVSMLGRFFMYGGVIRKNMAYSSGSGVHIYHALFEMYGGEIHNNEAGHGGGIFINFNRSGFESRNPYDQYIFDFPEPDGTYAYDDTKSEREIEDENIRVGNAPKQGFFMYGGEIHNNHVGADGGGIFGNYRSHCYIYGGKIHDNSAWSIAGVCSAGYIEMGRRSGPKTHTVPVLGTFTEEVPEIYDNWGGYGGGLDIFDMGVFVLWDAIIHNNTADGTGGGVVINSNFYMHGGEIYGNSSNSGVGGGIYIRPGGALFMTGGTIYGEDSTDPERTGNQHATSQKGTSLYMARDNWDDPVFAVYGTLPPNSRGYIADYPVTMNGDMAIFETFIFPTDKTITVKDGKLLDVNGDEKNPIDWD